MGMEEDAHFTKERRLGSMLRITTKELQKSKNYSPTRVDMALFVQQLGRDIIAIQDDQPLAKCFQVYDIRS